MNNENKILPSDVHLEEAVLGAIIQTPSLLYQVDGYFSSAHDVLHHNRSRILWKKLKYMVHENRVIDLVTVASALTEKDKVNGVTMTYLTDVTTNSALPTKVEIYGKQLYEKFLLRKVIEKTYTIQDKAYSNVSGVFDEVVDAHTYLGELIQYKPDKTFDIEIQMDKTIEAITDEESKLIHTGYSGLDDLAGGLTRGEITIVGGRPGHGKTTVLINILANMVGNGYRCIFFNRELPNSELLKKLMALESGKLSYSMIRKGIYDSGGLKELSKVKELIIRKYNKSKMLMFDNLRNFSKSAAEVKKFKPDVIFDDYIQLISPTKMIEQRRLQLEALVNDYKWLAKEMQCVVVLASQLNRALEVRREGVPQLSDLAESGAIEQVAENVFFSYYDYKINGSNGKGKNVITMYAKKVRYGETGSCDLGFNGDKARVYNSVEDFAEDLKKEMTVNNDKEKIPF